MKKGVLTSCILIGIFFSSLNQANEISNNHCPDKLVNFWRKFSTDNDPQTMPSFLVVNECVTAERREKQTRFYLTTQLRFDQPTNHNLVNQLYTDLQWGTQQKN